MFVGFFPICQNQIDGKIQKHKNNNSITNKRRVKEKRLVEQNAQSGHNSLILYLSVFYSIKQYNVRVALDYLLL